MAIYFTSCGAGMISNWVTRAGLAILGAGDGLILPIIWTGWPWHERRTSFTFTHCVKRPHAYSCSYLALHFLYCWLKDPSVTTNSVGQPAPSTNHGRQSHGCAFSTRVPPVQMGLAKTHLGFMIPVYRCLLPPVLWIVLGGYRCSLSLPSSTTAHSILH